MLLVVVLMCEVVCYVVCSLLAVALRSLCVVRCLMGVVCSLLFVVYCSSFVVHCLLSVVCCCMFVFEVRRALFVCSVLLFLCYLSSVVRCCLRLFVKKKVWCVLFVGCGLLVVGRCYLFVGRLLFVDQCPLLLIVRCFGVCS